MKIDTNLIVPVIQHYLNAGSESRRITANDIHVYVHDQTREPEDMTIMQLIEGGTPLFDAIIYYFMENKDGVRINDGDLGTNELSYNDKLQALVYVYMWAMIRGDILSRNQVYNEGDVPLFLRNVLQLKDQPGDYVSRIASFDLINLDHQWIKDMKPEFFHSRIKNRLSMGIAGHRYLDVFKYFNPKEDATEDQKQICARLRQKASMGPFWDLHPLFKPQLVISNLGSINKTLANFIFEAFSDAQVNEMKRCKYLPEAVIPDHRNVNYTTLNDANLALIGNRMVVEETPTTPAVNPEAASGSSQNNRR